jgi:hypothetical protein
MLLKPTTEHNDRLNDSGFDNGFIASRLEETADLLRSQNANPFRVKAYINAAQTIRNLDQEITDLGEDLTVETLLELDLPGIGKSMAQSIVSLAKGGRLGYLQKLRGETNAESLLHLVPTIGPELSELLHNRLHVDTLFDLEKAIKANALQKVPGIGEKRERAIREFFVSRSYQRIHSKQPTVGELLELDEKYRQLAETGSLPKILPENDPKRRWIPVWHVDLDTGHYTVMFSATTRAYKLGKTRDWVVIHRDGPIHQGQWTVITAAYGNLAGKRIVCGQEKETYKFYKTG